MKRTIALLFSLVLLLMVFSACQPKVESPATTKTESAVTEEKKNNEATEEPTDQIEIINCNYVIPGGAPKDYDIVAEKINEKLAQDNVGITFERTYIAWDVWEQKINIMLSSGEPFDMFHVMQDWIPFSSYLAKGGVIDLTELIQEYGQNITENIPTEIFSGVMKKDKIYAVPANWVELAFNSFSWRGDLEEEYGLTIPKDEDDLLAQMKKASDNWKGASYDNYFLLRGADYDPAEVNFLYNMYPEYQENPFVIKDKIFMVYQDGKVSSFCESDTFKRASEFFGKAQDMGLINPDTLVIQPEQKEEIARSGDWLVYFGADSTSPTFIQQNYPEYTRDGLKLVSFTEDAPIRSISVKNCNAVPATTENPEAAIKFLNWLYSNQDNYDLYMYGVEGTHYEKAGDGYKNSVKNSATNETDYVADDWMTGNLNFLRCDSELPTVTAQAWYTYDEDAKNSVAASFLFDPTPVQAELANVKTVWASSFVPIFFGFLDYQEDFEAAMDRMNAAGIDAVINEYQSQLDAFLAGE